MRSFRTLRAGHLIRAPLGLALVFAGLLTACGRDDPTAPNAFRISGRVALTGFPTAADGTLAGTRVVTDADDVRGDVLEVLADGPLLQGRQELFWTARDAAGHTVPPGAYWITVRTAEGLRAQLVFRD